MPRLLKSNVFYFSVGLQLFSGFGFFISLFVVVMSRQQMRVRFCTRKVPGRWSLHSFFDDCSHLQKKGTYTKTITFGIKNGPCEAWSFFPFSLPFFSLSTPFPLPFFSVFLPFLLLFLLLAFVLSFSFSSYSFPFPFLFLSFSFPFFFLFPFPFPFLVLSLSYAFLSLPLLFLFLLPFLAHVNPLVKV